MPPTLADTTSVLAVTEENEIYVGTFAVQLGRAEQC